MDDAVEAETFLHRALRDKKVHGLKPCSELFNISAAEALEHFEQIPEAQIRGFDRVSRMRGTEALLCYLASLFLQTGLENFLNHQGVWSLSLFPSTAGGRYFTMNIDRHEVAFSSLPKQGNPAVHMLVLDELIWDYRETSKWLKAHQGGNLGREYSSGLEGQAIIAFEGTLETALEFLDQPGVRRGLLAYWYDLLLSAADRGRGSLHAKHHNLAAVSDVMRSVRALKI